MNLNRRNLCWISSRQSSSSDKSKSHGGYPVHQKELRTAVMGYGKIVVEWFLRG
jgi:hypothetical protein